MPPVRVQTHPDRDPFPHASSHPFIQAVHLGSFPNAFTCQRLSRFRNPFPLHVYSRAESVSRFIDYSFTEGSPTCDPLTYPSGPLGCRCAPLLCHCHVLALRRAYPSISIEEVRASILGWIHPEARQPISRFFFSHHWRLTIANVPGSYHNAAFSSRIRTLVYL